MSNLVENVLCYLSLNDMLEGFKLEVSSITKASVEHFLLRNVKDLLHFLCCSENLALLYLMKTGDFPFK